MMPFDAMAYRSPLRRWDPREKLFQAVLALGAILWSSGMTVPMMILATVLVILVGINKTSVITLIKAMAIPLGFMAMGTLMVLFHLLPDGHPAIWSLMIGDARWGVTTESLILSAHVAVKAIASISCLYCLILTTPMPDICHGFGQLGCPKIIIELMQLMYLMIFLLLDTTVRIYSAQQSRLGYETIGDYFREMGTLASMTLIHAVKRADALYTSLEARGYDGNLNDFETTYETSIWGYVLPVLSIVLIIRMN